MVYTQHECALDVAQARQSANALQTPTGRPAGRPVNSKPDTRASGYFLVFTACFNCLPARNAGAMDALI